MNNLLIAAMYHVAPAPTAHGCPEKLNIDFTFGNSEKHVRHQEM